MSAGRRHANNNVPHEIDRDAMPMMATAFLPKVSSMMAPTNTCDKILALPEARVVLPPVAVLLDITKRKSAQWADPDHSVLDFGTAEQSPRLSTRLPAGHLPFTGSGIGQTTMERKKDPIKSRLSHAKNQ
mmetsp:Transcript_10644/g.33657  ORF Transcript_10644/g.33657 Transcript_10644/m.33657 type:complete len:130 (-) Transcript_10644:161-550(-)